MKHRTKDGRKMEISDMGDRHLLNTIKMYERRAKEGVVVIYACCGPGGEDPYYDEDVFYGFEALEAMGYKNYVDEANKRGLYEKT